MTRALIPLLLLALAPQEEPLHAVPKDCAILYRYALEHRFSRVTERRLLALTTDKCKQIESVKEATTVAAGGFLLVAGDAEAPVTVGENAMLEIGGSIKAPIECAAGSAIVIRGSVGRGVKITLRDSQVVFGGRVDGMITVESPDTDLLFAGPRPDPDQVIGAIRGVVVFRDLLSAEDENLWFRSHSEIRIIARAAAKPEFRIVGDAGRVLLTLPDSPPLYRALTATVSLPTVLTRPFCDAKLQKTIASVKEESDGGKHIKIPSQASIAWYSALKADVTIRERVGLTVIDADLAAGRSLTLAKVDGASSNLVLISGSVAGTLDVSSDRGGTIIIGGDIAGVLLMGSEQQVLVRGSVLKGSTVQLRAGSVMMVLGSDDGTLLEAVRKTDGAACVVAKGAKAGLLRVGTGVYSVLEAR